MSDVVIDGNRVGEAKQLATRVENSVKRSHDICETLVSNVAASKWEGKSRDAFLSYIEIIEQYHAELNEVVKLQTEALGNLENYIAEFPQDNRVRRMRNI